MGEISICFVVILLVYGPIFRGESFIFLNLPGPCQPFRSNQTEHCAELETLVQDHGKGTFCNSSQASCHPDAVLRFRSNQNERDYWERCYCDAFCQEIGDCCVDYEMWYTPHAPNHETKQRHKSCQREPSYKKKTILGYIMVASCPPSWSNDETARACVSTSYTADPLTALPVLDMTTNVTYANMYCAMCHGRSRNLHHWSLRIMLRRGRPISLNDIKSEDTMWEAVPMGGVIPKKCVATPSEAKVGPDTTIKRLCRSYGNSVSQGNPIQPLIIEEFKNPHCALLSDPNVFVNKTVKCFKPHRIPSRVPTMLFVFSIKGENSKNAREVTNRLEADCQINSVYDPFKSRCLPVHTDAKDNGANSSEQCRGPAFPPNEFSILSNDSVLLIPHQKVYNNGTYIVVNHTLILCSANFSRNYTKTVKTTGHVKEKEPTHSLVLCIITYVGFSLSIISLLFLLVTYFLFSELRTYAGKHVMHLSCAMIAMQSVYFVSDPDLVSSAVCAVMGALLHFFILAVFLWMSIIAHNTRKTLSNMNVNPHNPIVIAGQRKAYIRYSVFAWGFPLVVVGICVALQFASVGNVGYGVKDGCQLSIPARTFAVAVPVTASLLYNIIAVIISANAIGQHGQANIAASQSNRNLPVIVMKMTVVSGATWILGFALAFYPTPYLEYPFIIINCFQGVMICLSFVFKKRVLNLYKQRFSTTNVEQTTTEQQEDQEERRQPEKPVEPMGLEELEAPGQQENQEQQDNHLENTRF